MFEFSAPLLPPTEHSSLEYERIIGIECRALGSSAAATSSPAAAAGLTSFCVMPGNHTPYPADLLIASCDGSETRIESVRCTFAWSPVVEKRTLVAVLKGRKDIVHASLSASSGDTFLSFTERVALQPRKKQSVLTSSTGGPSPSPRRTDSSSPPPPSEFQYYLWLHVVNTEVYEDATVRDPPSANSHPNALPPNQHCQVGYMIRSEASKSSTYWLRACDHSLSGLQIKELHYNRKKGCIEVRGLLEWNLAQNQLWHQWDPFTQRVYFWAALPYYKLRVVRICGHPEKRRCDFEQNIGKLKYPLFTGRPLSTPWGTANCTSCVNYHITVVPIRYECDAEDLAMCRQLLPSATTAATPDTFLGKVICTITLLRNFIDQIEVQIDMETPISMSDHNYRVSFLFVNGMIAIYLPNVFVHYVDVSHKEVAPKYLFGVSLATDSPENASSQVSCQVISNNEAAPQQVQQDAAMSTPIRADPSASLLSTVFSDPLTTSGATPPQPRSPCMTSSMTSHCFPRDYSRDCAVTLPIPSGNWILTPDTTLVRRVGLLKSSVWVVIAEKLHDSCASNSVVADPSTLHHALHVVSSHFPHVSGPRGIQATLPLQSAQLSQEYFANHLRELIGAYWREIKPPLLTQLIIGEAYQATRAVCKQIGNPYYLCMTMDDDKALQVQLEDQHQRARALRGAATAGWSSGGIVRTEAKRELDGRVKDLCHNTDPDWWLVRGIKQNTTLFGKIKAFGKSSVMPIQRISISDGAKMTRFSSMTYAELIAARLRSIGVPPQPSAQVATIFEQAVSKIVDEILEIVSKPEEELHVRTQFHFLHHVSIAVHMLGVRCPTELTERFAMLAATTLPPVAMLHGIKSGLYTPSLHTLEKALREVSEKSCNFSSRFGSKLSEKDVAAAEATTRIPLAVASPTEALADGCMSSSLATLSLPRYDKTPNGARHPSLRIATSTVMRQWTLTNLISCATELEKSSERKEYFLSAFESGPQLQMHGRKGLPRDADYGIDFPPWKQWLGKGSYSRQGSPAHGGVTGLFGNSTQFSQWQVTDAMRKGRAKEVVEYVLSPLGGDHSH